MTYITGVKPWNNDMTAHDVREEHVYIDYEDEGKTIPCCYKIKTARIYDFIAIHQLVYPQSEDVEYVEGGNKLLIKSKEGEPIRTLTISLYKSTGIITAQGSRDRMEKWKENLINMLNLLDGIRAQGASRKVSEDNFDKNDAFILSSYIQSELCTSEKSQETKPDAELPKTTNLPLIVIREIRPLKEQLKITQELLSAREAQLNALSKTVVVQEKLANIQKGQTVHLIRTMSTNHLLSMSLKGPLHF